MGSTKHEKSFVDFEKPYEQNVIGFKGIVYFAVFLVALIVVTFGLMWAFKGLLEQDAEATKKSTNPMAASERDRLPPEPRLQAAPGFGVDGPKGRVNLELREPQAEYRELRREWEQTWQIGQKDEKSGTVVSLPIDEAKKMVLESNMKSKAGADTESLMRQSQLVISDSSAGRVSNLRRR